jgi:hypothetical protein
MTLPWDRYTPEPAPEPTPAPPAVRPPDPVVPPDNVVVPNPPTTVGIGDLISATIRATITQILPAIKDQALGYARASINAAGADQEVDHTHPTITATTSNGRSLVVADAKSRSWRTLVQGLIIDLIYALIATLATLSGMDPFEKETWLIFGALVIKTIVQTVISYIARIQVTPTIRTPDGEKMALMPAPREPLPSDSLTHRSDHTAAMAPLLGQADVEMRP